MTKYNCDIVPGFSHVIFIFCNARYENYMGNSTLCKSDITPLIVGYRVSIYSVVDHH